MVWKYTINAPLDSPERTLRHREIIDQKPFLRSLYRDFYSAFQQSMRDIPSGARLELGAGGGFLKTIVPDVICSDILKLPTNDITFSALEMPIADNALAAIFMMDTFHHIPDAAAFLTEAQRVLKPGGIAMMIEPANSAWGRFVYRYFHHEPFVPEGNWTIPRKGPMSGANGALPWIVFVRDKHRFEADFPHLQMAPIRYHTPLQYLLSGGVSRHCLLPRKSYALFKGIDRRLSSFHPELSMFMTITLRKTIAARET